MKSKSALSGSGRIWVVAIVAILAAAAYSPAAEAGPKNGRHNGQKHRTAWSAPAHGSRSSRETSRPVVRRYADAAPRYADAPQCRYIPQRHYAPSRYYAPRPVYVAPRLVRAPVVCRPWWADAPRVYYDHRPYYYSASIGVYVGGFALDFTLADTPPRGYVYYDPYCGEDFYTTADYHRHADQCHHPVVLDVVAVDEGY